MMDYVEIIFNYDDYNNVTDAQFAKMVRGVMKAHEVPVVVIVSHESNIPPCRLRPWTHSSSNNRNRIENLHESDT